MNFLAMAQRVKRESGRGSVAIASVVTATGEDLDICNWVAAAWRDIQLMAYNWAWMRVSIIGDLVIDTIEHSPLSLGAANFRKWVPESDDYRMTVYESSNTAAEWPIRFLPYERFRGRFIVGDQTAAAPQFWTQSPQGNFMIGPKPDLGTYKLRADYFMAPDELAEDNDVPGMPDQFHMLIVWDALMHAASFDAAPEVHSRARDNSEKMLNSLIDHQGEKIKFRFRPLA